MHGFELFFAARFAEAHAAEQRLEQERRAAAFLDVAESVAGIPLRPLTPHDLFLLDGFASPFAVGDPATASPEHIISVLWLLRRDRPSAPSRLREWWSYRRHEAQLTRRWRQPAALVEDHAALTLWFENTFAEIGGGRSTVSASRPPPSHFLATLLVPLAADMGHIDPASGLLLVHTPIARLAQYSRTLARREADGKRIEFAPSDKILGDALKAYNELTPEERQDWERRAAACDRPEPAAAAT